MLLKREIFINRYDKSVVMLGRRRKERDTGYPVLSCAQKSKRQNLIPCF